MLRNHQLIGDDPGDNHVPLSDAMLMMTCFLLAWSCLKLEKQLRIYLSGGC